MIHALTIIGIAFAIVIAAAVGFVVGVKVASRRAERTLQAIDAELDGLLGMIEAGARMRRPVTIQQRAS